MYMLKLLTHQERSIISSSWKPKGDTHQVRSTSKASQEKKRDWKRKKEKRERETSKREILKNSSRSEYNKGFL